VSRDRSLAAHAAGSSIASNTGNLGDASEQPYPAEQCEVSFASQAKSSIAIPKTVGRYLSIVAEDIDVSERRVAGAGRDSQERAPAVSEEPISACKVWFPAT
jgi:hypothetical protein